MSTDEEFEQNLTMAMHEAHYSSNIDSWGDEGAGYNHTLMYQTFMASEPFEAWLAAHDEDNKERIASLGNANVRKNLMLIAIREFVQEWPDDFSRKRDEVLRLMEDFQKGKK